MRGKTEPFYDTVLPPESEETPVSVVENVVDVPKTSEQVHFGIPENVKRLLNKKAVDEDRTVTAVINRALKKFLAEEMCEDRPYIPIELEKVTKISFTANLEIVEKLTERAKAEGRTPTILLTKAIMNYVAESEEE